MDKVYAIEYGSIDNEEEVTQALYNVQSDAVEAVEADIQTIFDDNPDYTEDGFVYEMTTDSNGDPIGIISLNGTETEWWRVVERKVY